jgi:hypothetical protein
MATKFVRWEGLSRRKRFELELALVEIFILSVVHDRTLRAVNRKIFPHELHLYIH